MTLQALATDRNAHSLIDFLHVDVVLRTSILTGDFVILFFECDEDLGVTEMKSVYVLLCFAKEHYCHTL